MDRANILGVGVSAVNMEMAVAKIQSWIERRAPNYVDRSSGALHRRVLAARRASSNLQTGWNGCAPDGMPIVWISRLMGHRQVERVHGPDLMLAVCQRSVNSGYRHFTVDGRHKWWRSLPCD